VSVALTNEPNIRGGRPIANRKTEDGGQRSEVGGEALDGATTNGESSLVENRGGGAKKYRWVLGDPPSGEHCKVCLARAGKIKTAPEWAAMGMPPCNCHCTLEEVDDETANRWSNVARAASLAVRKAKAERRKAEGGRVKDKSVTGEGEVSRQDAKAQRLDAARAAVMRDLAAKRIAQR